MIEEQKKVDRFYEVHLELDGDYSDPELMAVLKKYGKVNKSISRDIIVPEDITLHSLHFAIQRAFGWENSHLHRFGIDDDYTDQKLYRLTENSFDKYLHLCGIYCRFPYDIGNEETAHEIYYDDDYDGYESPKSWMRRKYTGPYRYPKDFEYYLEQQKLVKNLRENETTVTVPPSFHEYLKAKESGTKPAAETVKETEMKLDAAKRYFEGGIGELLEKLRLDEVLGKTSVTDFSELEDLIQHAEEGLDQAVSELDECRQKVAEAMKYVGKMNKILNTGNFTQKNSEFLRKYSGYREAGIRAAFTIQELQQKHEPERIPVTDELYYFYDYGDGWMVKITITNLYAADIKDDNTVFFTDRNGNPADTQTVIALDKAMKSYTVKCIRYDGLSVMDDVGGLSGYMNYLKTIREGAPLEKEDMKNWGSMMGWSSASKKPENLL